MTWHGLRFLCEAKRAGLELGKTVTIGRQHCDVSGPRILRMFADHEIEAPAGLVELTRGPDHADPVLLSLGASHVESIDNSAYESASKLWDLNEPIPSDWHESYDLLYDSGSIEHVFHVPNALANYMQLVRVGGHVVIHTMANNWCGHGFYQLSPELLYRAFSEANGFRVVRMAMFETYEHAPMYEIPDPAAIRSRIELSNAWIGVDVIVLAKREKRVTPFARWPQQSDYASRWAEFAAAPPPDPAPAPPPDPAPAAPSGRRQLTDSLKRRLPALVEWKHWLLARFPAFSRSRSRSQSAAYHKTHSFQAQPDRYRTQ